MDGPVPGPNIDNKSTAMDASQCLCFVNENGETESVARTWSAVFWWQKNSLRGCLFSGPAKGEWLIAHCFRDL